MNVMCLGLVLLASILGAKDARAQVQQNVDVQVNVPYAVQFGFGSYDVGGLSVDVFRIPVTRSFTLGPDPSDWRLAVTGYPGYGRISLETRALGPKLTAAEDFAFVLFDAELQIPLRPWWTLKPYVEAGFGKTFGGAAEIDGRTVAHLDETFFWLYSGGISNLFGRRARQPEGVAWTPAARLAPPGRCDAEQAPAASAIRRLDLDGRLTLPRRPA